MFNKNFDIELNTESVEKEEKKRYNVYSKMPYFDALEAVNVGEMEARIIARCIKRNHGFDTFMIQVQNDNAYYILDRCNGRFDVYGPCKHTEDLLKYINLSLDVELCKDCIGLGGYNESHLHEISGKEYVAICKTVDTFNENGLHCNIYVEQRPISLLLEETHKKAEEDKRSEMDKFREMLDEKGIPWHDKSEWNIIRTHADDGSFSVICGPSTYGGEAGLLEVMSDKTKKMYEEEELYDEVVGFQTAESVWNYI